MLMKRNKVKYLAIYEELQQQIINGDYLVGDLMPAEPDLQKRYNVSRITVRHAVQLLVDEGYVERIHGVGTIVLSQKKSLQLQNLLSFSEENKEHNIQSTLFSFEASIPASPLVCSQLDLPKMRCLVVMNEYAGLMKFRLAFNVYIVLRLFLYLLKSSVQWMLPCISCFA